MKTLVLLILLLKASAQAQTLDPGIVPGYIGTNLPEGGYSHGQMYDEAQARALWGTGPDAEAARAITQSFDTRPEVIIDDGEVWINNAKRAEQVPESYISIIEDGYGDCINVGPATGGGPTTIQCGSNFYCPDGLCDDLSASQSSTDFGKATSWLGMLTQMGVDKEPDPITLFEGDIQRCTKWVFNIKNCCSNDSGVLGAFGCTQGEILLLEKRKARLTHYVGQYCSKKTFFKCLVRARSFCTFSSRFALIFQEQARPQLGLGWGGAKHPDCRSLTIEEIQQVDFSQIDLSELYADMLNKANVASPGVVSQQIQDRIDAYYRRNQ